MGAGELDRVLIREFHVSPVIHLPPVAVLEAEST